MCCISLCGLAVPGIALYTGRCLLDPCSTFNGYSVPLDLTLLHFTAHSSQEWLPALYRKCSTHCAILTEQLCHRDDEKHRLSTYFCLLRQGGSANSAGTLRGLQNFTTDIVFSLLKFQARCGQEASVNCRGR